MRFLVMFVTAVCVLFLIKLRWPKKKNFYYNYYYCYYYYYYIITVIIIIIIVIIIIIIIYIHKHHLNNQQSPFGSKICSDICPRTLSVPGSEQFSSSYARVSDLRGTDNVCRRTSEHIFAPNLDYCLFLDQTKTGT